MALRSAVELREQNLCDPLLVGPQHKIKAIADAAALTVMASRGQITGAIADGSLAFDNAISIQAAQAKEITSPVAGRADILFVPDLEVGPI